MKRREKAAPVPRQAEVPATPDLRQAPKQANCSRCGDLGPVGDEGFCLKCEKALEQACL